MKNFITRYNRTFFGFMEMCNTGNWCEFSEVEDAIDKQEIIRRSYEIELQKTRDWHGVYYNSTTAEIKKLKLIIQTLLCASICTLVFGMVVGVAVFYA